MKPSREMDVRSSRRRPGSIGLIRHDPGLRRDDELSDVQSSIAARARGFTLLEILVAFVVIGVLGAAMLQLFQGSLRNVALSSEYTEAAMLARSKLAEWEARAAPEPGMEEGDLDDRYRWRVELVPYVPDADAQNGQMAVILPPSVVDALRLTLTISWGEAGDVRDYVVETVLLAPLQAQTTP